MLNPFHKGFITLVRSGLTGEKLELPKNFSAKNLFAAAKAHRAISIVYEGCVNCGLDKENEDIKPFLSGSAFEMMRYERQNSAVKALTQAFNSNNVDYIMLKGMRTGKLYPMPFMRVLGDADIYIRQSHYEKISKLLTQLGFTYICKTDNVYVWHKEKALHLEVHSELMSVEEADYFDYFADFWKKAYKDSNSSEHFFKAEDEFIFIFSHFAKHYRDSGIGVRQLCDLWLLNKNNNYDEEYIINELKKLELDKFYVNTMKAVYYWFEGEKGNEVTELLCSTVINGGAFGTYNDHIIYETVKKNKKGIKNVKQKMFFEKVFPKPSAISKRYKFLKKAPYLIFIAWICRWFDAVFYNRNRIVRSVDELKQADEKAMENRKQLLSMVGLNL